VSPLVETTPGAAARPKRRRRLAPRKSSVFANGEPMVWLTGGALALCLAMITGLLALVVLKGVGTFWPGRIVRVETVSGRAPMGEVTASEDFRPEPSVRRRTLRSQSKSFRGSTIFSTIRLQGEKFRAPSS